MVRNAEITLITTSNNAELFNGLILRDPTSSMRPGLVNLQKIYYESASGNNGLYRKGLAAD